tara:strand:- start:232 stop:486 length:255 start_codon:yes stop_codon:yes gene_type:complete
MTIITKGMGAIIKAGTKTFSAKGKGGKNISRNVTWDQDLNKDFSYKPFIGQGKKRQGSLFSLRKGGKNKKSKQLKFKFKKSQVK